MESKYKTGEQKSRSIDKANAHWKSFKGILVCHYFAIMALLISCVGKPEKDVAIHKGSVKTNLFMEGTWLLTEYFDSAVSRSSIFNVKDIPPSRFASVISISADSIKTFGSMEDIALPLDQFTPDESGTLRTSYGEWGLSISDSTLSIKEHRAASAATFHYRRYEGQLAAAFNASHYSDFVIDYFNRHILAGQYEVLAPNGSSERIIFGSDGSLTNWKEFDHYRIYTFHRSQHPYSETDAMVLSNSKNDLTKMLAWSSNGDIMTVFDLTDDEQYPGEVLHKGQELLRLRKIK